MLMRLLMLLFVWGWAVSGEAAVTITFLQSATSTADLATYTFSAQNLGTAAADRCVVVGIESRKAVAAATTITSVTIGGNAATIVVQEDASNSSTNVAGIAALLVTSGTTADIVVTFSQTMSRSEIDVYAMTGASACGTTSDTDVSTAIEDPSVSLDIPANGGAIAASSNASGAANRSATWTGLTERYETQNLDGALAISGASDVFASQQTGLAITCNWSGSGQALETVGVFAAWGPAAAGAKPARVIGAGIFD